MPLVRFQWMLLAGALLVLWLDFTYSSEELLPMVKKTSCAGRTYKFQDTCDKHGNRRLIIHIKKFNGRYCFYKANTILRSKDCQRGKRICKHRKVTRNFDKLKGFFTQPIPLCNRGGMRSIRVQYYTRSKDGHHSSCDSREKTFLVPCSFTRTSCYGNSAIRLKNLCYKNRILVTRLYYKVKINGKCYRRKSTLCSAMFSCKKQKKCGGFKAKVIIPCKGSKSRRKGAVLQINCYGKKCKRSTKKLHISCYTLSLGKQKKKTITMSKGKGGVKRRSVISLGKGKGGHRKVTGEGKGVEKKVISMGKGKGGHRRVAGEGDGGEKKVISMRKGKGGHRRVTGEGKGGKKKVISMGKGKGGHRRVTGKGKKKKVISMGKGKGGHRRVTSEGKGGKKKVISMGKGKGGHKRVTGKGKGGKKKVISLGKGKGGHRKVTGEGDGGEKKVINMGKGKGGTKTVINMGKGKGGIRCNGRKNERKGRCRRTSKGKFHRTVTYWVWRVQRGKCRHFNKTQRQICHLNACPKSYTIRGDCKKTWTQTRARKMKARRKRKRVFHTGKIRVKDVHYYYVRDSYGRCKKRSSSKYRKCKQHVCECYAWGDPHYMTFFNSKINLYKGNCKYTLAESLDKASKCHFHILGKNIHKPKIAFTNYMEVRINGHVYKLGRRRHVTVDDHPVNVPYRSKNGRVYIFNTGKDVELLSEKCGVRVLFDGNYNGVVHISSSYAGRMQGLCGDCKNKKNDFRTKLGKVTRNAAKLANSWLVSDDKGSRHCRVKKQPEIDDKSKEKYTGKEWCGLIKDKSGPWGKCIRGKASIAETFYEGCLIDMVLLSRKHGRIQKKDLCETFSLLTDTCAAHGFTGISWRTETNCPIKCPKNSNYRRNAEPCPKTCESFLLNIARTCSKIPRTEGCQCNPGYVLDGKKCIKPDKCPCLNCADMAPEKNCRRWKRQGYCTKRYEQYGMLQVCKKSCGFCQPRKHICEDIISSRICTHAHDRGLCSDSFYKRVCGLTCNWRKCPCQKTRVVKGKCEEDGTRTVTTFSFDRDENTLLCVADKQVTREQCRACKETTKTKWNKCNFCLGKKTGTKQEVYKKGIRCLKRKTTVSRKCSKCRFANGKKTINVDKYCKNGRSWIVTKKHKVRSGCYSCKVKDDFSVQNVKCRKTPKISTKPLAGQKKEQLKICKERLSKCLCDEKCTTITQPRECDPPKVVRRSCVVWNQKYRFDVYTVHQRLIRKNMHTRCKKSTKITHKNIPCPKRRRVMLVKKKACKLEQRISFYALNRKCICERRVKWKPKGHWCCLPKKNKKGPCNKRKGVNMLRRVTFFRVKLVKNHCIDSSNKGWEVCGCKPKKFQDQCKFGKLYKKFMECRLMRSLQGSYCKCSSTDVEIPIKCKTSYQKRLTKCKKSGGLNMYMKMRRYFYVKVGCKCKLRHRDYSLWCGCKKSLKKVTKCPKHCKDTRKCDNRCFKRHILYTGVAKIGGEGKYCQRKIISSRKERCCCSPVILDKKPRKKCGNKGRNWIVYTYRKKMCRGKRSGLYECCVVRTSKTRAVKCKEGIVKTSVSRCNNKGYMTITKHINKLKSCVCDRRVHNSSCRCRCPKVTSKKQCDKGKRVWRVTKTSYTKKKCECVRSVKYKEYPLNKCKYLSSLNNIPTRRQKGCDKRGFRNLYFDYEIRKGCDCVKKTKIKKCRCRCKSKKNYTKWRCNKVTGVLSRRMNYQKKRGCSCMNLGKNEKKNTVCKKPSKVNKLCKSNGQLLLQILAYKRNGCRCRWKIIDTRIERCRKPKYEINRKEYCRKNNIKVVEKNIIRQKPIYTKIGGVLVHYIKYTVKRTSKEHKVKCKKPTVPVRTTACKKGKYFKLIPVNIMRNCKCKPRVNRKMRRCSCNKKWNLVKKTCNPHKFAFVSIFQGFNWKHKEERCAKVTVTKERPVHCSAKNKVVKGPCVKGVYTLTTHFSVKDRKKCVCARRSSPMKLSCRCNPKVKKVPCDTKRCRRYTITTRYRWDHAKTKCVQINRPVKKAIVCCCSKKVTFKYKCDKTGKKTITRISEKFVTKPNPTCNIEKKDTYVRINCRSAANRKKLLKNRLVKGSCRASGWSLYKLYSLRLNARKCKCERYVKKRYQCRCRCRRGEQFERKYCKKGSHVTVVRVYSHQKLSQCACLTKYKDKSEKITCRKSNLKSYWSKCSKVNCHQYRIYVKEKAKNCKCVKYRVEQKQQRRRCCCNKPPKRSKKCTKRGWRHKTITYNFKISKRVCAPKTTFKLNQDEEMIGCKENVSFKKERKRNCVLLVYKHKYYRDYSTCTCKHHKVLHKAGKYCCNKKPITDKDCRHRKWVYKTTRQVLKNMKCVDKVAYDKQSIVCKPRRSIRGKCNYETGFAFDRVGEAHVLPTCICRQNYIARKRRCACPKPKFYTMCLEHAGQRVKVTETYHLVGEKCVTKEKKDRQRVICSKHRELKHTSKCGADNKKTLTYQYMARKGCECVKKFKRVRKVCRCDPLTSKKVKCLGKSWELRDYLHYVNKKGTACLKKQISKKKIPIPCKSYVDAGKCRPEGRKGRMVQTITRFVMKLKKCKCVLDNKIIGFKICHCPDKFETRGKCDKRTENVKIHHHTFTLNKQRTKCIKHTRTTKEVCYCNRRFRAIPSCDKKSGNKIIHNSWRQFDRVKKKCVRKRSNDVKEVDCPIKTVREKNDCTAVGTRTDILKKYYKDFNSCSCKDSSSPIKVTCACVPKCHKKKKVCSGRKWSFKQICYKLTRVSAYVNTCVKYTKQSSKEISCSKKNKYQKTAPCVGNFKTFYKWVYRNVNCKCKWIKKLWGRRRCRCPKSRCWNKCEKNGRYLYKYCKSFTLHQGECDENVKKTRIPIDCTPREESWTRCRKASIFGVWFRCTIWKTITLNRIRNCKCVQESRKKYERKCCCPPSKRLPKCNRKSGKTTVTHIKYTLVGEGICKKSSSKTYEKSPVCIGERRGKSLGSCNRSTNKQRFIVWKKYRSGCKCKERRFILTSGCSCRTKPIRSRIPPCKPSIKKAQSYVFPYIYYYKRVKIGKWRYICQRTKKVLEIKYSCAVPGKPERRKKCKKDHYETYVTRYVKIWKKIRYNFADQVIIINVPRIITKKETIPGRKINCGKIVEKPVKCNNFVKRFYRYYWAYNNCQCKLKRMLIMTRACDCHKKDRSKVTCNAATNTYHRMKIRYHAGKHAKCVKEDFSTKFKKPCNTGVTITDKVVLRCKHGKKTGLSIYKKVRYYKFIYNNCKCQRKYFSKWRLCGCRKKNKKEVCRNGKWYSTLYTVAPDYKHQTCTLKKRYTERDVHCNKNARIRKLTGCSNSCFRRYVVKYNRFDAKTCSCVPAKPIYLKQVCGCDKCPLVGRTKVTVTKTCKPKIATHITTTVKKIYVHNGNLFNKWGIILPKYMCKREESSKKKKIVCTRGTSVVKTWCSGAKRWLRVKRQQRVGCRCNTVFDKKPGGVCQCKNLKPKKPKVWKQDKCNKAPFKQRVTTYSYTLDKSNSRKWKCKLNSVTKKRRCGCPKTTRNSSYCNGKGVIIISKERQEFQKTSRSCEWKKYTSRKVAKCPKNKLSVGSMPPKKSRCSKSSGYMQKITKKWYEVDRRDCKCKLKTDTKKCPCLCSHLNKSQNEKCEHNNLLKWQSVTYSKKGCKCVKIVRGKKKYIRCKNEVTDRPDRIEVGTCNRSPQSPNIGTIKIHYVKEFPRNCACKRIQKTVYEPCDCSLISRYRSVTTRVCHKNGKFFVITTVYYIVGQDAYGQTRCVKKRKLKYDYLSKCYDRKRRPLKKVVKSGFNKCGAKRTNCTYHVMFQETQVKNCKCKWRTVEIEGRKCCCPKPKTSLSCKNNYVRVKTTLYYRLSSKGQCKRKSKDKNTTLRYKSKKSRFISSCGKGKKYRKYKRYFHAKFNFRKCIAHYPFKIYQIPCFCKPKLTKRKPRCDAKTNEWVYETVYRKLKGSLHNTSCTDIVKSKRTKSCTRKTPRLVLLKCDKRKKTRRRVTYYQIKKNCRCLNRKSFETLSCECSKRTWSVHKTNQCKRRKSGRAFYPIYQMGFVFNEKLNKCVSKKLKTSYKICGCPKSYSDKKCVRGYWKHVRWNFKINYSKNTCDKKPKYWTVPMKGCGLKPRRVKVIKEYVNSKTGFKHITYLMVVNKKCKCYKYKKEIRIEWDCEIILDNKKIKRKKISCWKGKKIISIAGKPYLDKSGHCSVDYTKTELDVTRYCPKNGKSQRKSIGSCNSKTGRLKIAVTKWKANTRKCRCDKKVTYEREICDCEPIHPTYSKNGCKDDKITFKTTFKWKLINKQCVLDKTTEEEDVPCKIGWFTKKGQCSRVTGYQVITRINRKLQKCKCNENKKKYKCKCRCPKSKENKYCIHKTGQTRVRTTTYRLSQCTCIKDVTTKYLKPPAPCGQHSKKEGRCIRDKNSRREISGYSKVRTCIAKRNGCKCQMACKNRQKLCYCSPNIKTETKCIGHTELQISTLKFLANDKANKCRWTVVSKNTVKKDCFGMVDIPDTRNCNKKNGVLIIKHWKYQPVKCKCKKKVYDVTRGRCKCDNTWKKVSEGPCDTTESCTKEITYERKLLRGIRCVRDRKKVFAKCSCACEPEVPQKRLCNTSTGSWETTVIGWKLKCSKNTDSCKCERHKSKNVNKVTCNKKQELPYCNKKTRKVRLVYRKQELNRSTCKCYWSVYKRKTGWCHCKKPRHDRKCEASKRRIKITTTTYTLDGKRWQCLSNKKSRHIPVKPACKPDKSVRHVRCNKLKDMKEHKYTTHRWIDPVTCECKKNTAHDHQPCMCPKLPKKKRYTVHCNTKEGKKVHIQRWLELKKNKQGRKYCKLIIKEKSYPVECGLNEWKMYKSKKKPGTCDIKLFYRKKVRKGCTCIYLKKFKWGKACCPRTKTDKKCKANGKEFSFVKTVWSKIGYKCLNESRKWSKTVVCKASFTKSKCMKDGREKLTKYTFRPVSCKCKPFSSVDWCVCKCPSKVKEQRCEIENKILVISRTFFKKKKCMCDVDTKITRTKVECGNQGVSYKKLGKCSSKSRKQPFMRITKKFDGETCKCIVNKKKIYRTCSCRPAQKTYGKCNKKTCYRPLKFTKYRFKNWKCIPKSRNFSEVCCCHKNYRKTYKCSASKSRLEIHERWRKFMRNYGQPFCKDMHTISAKVFKCNTEKITYKDSKCVGRTYTRRKYKNIIYSSKHKLGTKCKCKKVMIEKVTRFCRCPKAKVVKAKCVNNNVQKYHHIRYTLNDGQCDKHLKVTSKLLKCPRHVLKRFKWSKCDKRTCKQKKYGTICKYDNCDINAKVDYANPKIFDCCCQSEKARIKYLECRDKVRTKVYRKFWQVYDAKRRKCNNFVKDLYTFVKCGGKGTRQYIPGKCNIKGKDQHFYQNVRVRYELYEEGCVCTKKSFNMRRLCKCRKPKQVKICRKDGVKVFRNIRYRLRFNKKLNKRVCESYVHKHWIEEPGCKHPSKAKWKKNVGKCVKNIKVILDHRKILIGCRCKKETKTTKVICGCSKHVSKVTKCVKGRWVTTHYGKRLTCRSERFCHCEKYKKTTRRLPDCNKGFVTKSHCKKGFQKIHARLYTVKKCRCTLREFKTHRRCPKKCQDLVSSKKCKEIVKEGLCEHPQRAGLAGQICAKSCGKCFDCPHPHEAKFASYSGYNLKSGSRYAKRFYIRTIRKAKITRCMIECKKDAGCNSFDFNPEKRTCVLNTVSQFSVEDRLTTYKKQDHIDEKNIHFVKYCKHRCKCGLFRPASKCICKGKGKLKRCYKRFSLREYYNKKNGLCAMRSKVSYMQADCDNPCVDQISPRVCRKMKKDGKCAKDRETRFLCNKTCSHCVCNKNYAVKVRCKRVLGKNRLHFQRHIMNVRYKRSKCGICTTSFDVKTYKCKPKLCFEQTIKKIGDCINNKRVIFTYKITLTDTNQCLMKRINKQTHSCKGVCGTVKKTVSKCRYHKRDKKNYRTVTYSYWLSDGGRGKEFSYNRKFMCSPTLCPKEIQFPGPCVLGHRYRYHIYYVLDYRHRCTKYVDAIGETCTRKHGKGKKTTKKRCRDQMPRKACKLVKKKNECFRHTGPSTMCMKTCGKCKRHRVNKKTKITKKGENRAVDVIKGITSRYGGRYLEEVVEASLLLSKSTRGKKYLRKYFVIPGVGRKIKKKKGKGKRTKKGKVVRRRGKGKTTRKRVSKEGKKLKVSTKIKGNTKTKTTVINATIKKKGRKYNKRTVKTDIFEKNNKGKYTLKKTDKRVYTKPKHKKPVVAKIKKTNRGMKKQKKRILKSIKKKDDAKDGEEEFEISGLHIVDEKKKMRKIKKKASKIIKKKEKSKKVSRNDNTNINMIIDQDEKKFKRKNSGKITTRKLLKREQRKSRSPKKLNWKKIRNIRNLRKASKGKSRRKRVFVDKKGKTATVYEESDGRGHWVITKGSGYSGKFIESEWTLVSTEEYTVTSSGGWEVTGDSGWKTVDIGKAKSLIKVSSRLSNKLKKARKGKSRRKRVFINDNGRKATVYEESDGHGRWKITKVDGYNGKFRESEWTLVSTEVYTVSSSDNSGWTTESEDLKHFENKIFKGKGKSIKRKTKRGKSKSLVKVSNRLSKKLKKAPKGLSRRTRVFVNKKGRKATVYETSDGHGHWKITKIKGYKGKFVESEWTLVSSEVYVVESSDDSGWSTSTSGSFGNGWMLESKETKNLGKKHKRKAGGKTLTKRTKSNGSAFNLLRKTSTSSSSQNYVQDEDGKWVLTTTHQSKGKSGAKTNKKQADNFETEIITTTEEYEDDGKGGWKKKSSKTNRAIENNSSATSGVTSNAVTTEEVFEDTGSGWKSSGKKMIFK